MRHLSLFSGIGGFDLASEWMGWNNIAHCEISEFNRRILKHYWPNAESIKDITTTNFSRFRGKIDIITGGFPCQPFSVAGKRKGKDDNRYLWPEMLRAINEIRPAWVVGENVAGITSMVFDPRKTKVESQTTIEGKEIHRTMESESVIERISEDFESIGYSVQPINIPACGVGAPHKRERIWFIAYSYCSYDKSKRQYGYHQKETGNYKGKEPREEWQRLRVELRDNGQQWDASNSTSSGWSQNNQEYKTRQLEQNFSSWERFPTVSPLCNGDDGLSSGSYFKTLSREHRMDRSLVIKGALDSNRIEVDFDTGEIFSRTIRGKNGQKVKLKGSDCNGYRVHNIYFEGVKKQCRAHQIIWIAANGLYDKSKLMIDHINRKKSDNRLCNLRLVDAKGNRSNAPNPPSKFNQDVKDAMHFLHTNGHMNYRELAEDFGCSKSRVHQIVSRHNGIYSITFPKWRAESIKAGGNAIVPQVAYEIFKAIEQTRWDKR